VEASAISVAIGESPGWADRYRRDSGIGHDLGVIARDRARSLHSPTHSPSQQSLSHLSYASYATPVRWADARGGA
jgi:hypothetical protein